MVALMDGLVYTHRVDSPTALYARYSEGGATLRQDNLFFLENISKTGLVFIEVLHQQYVMSLEQHEA